MKHSVKKLFYVLSVILLAAVLVLALFTAWFYLTPLSAFKEKVATVAPYPAALVAGRPITLNEVLKRQAAANSPMGNILAEIIAEKQTAIVAKKYGVSVSGAQLDAQLSQLEQQPNFAALLLTYGLNENDFKNNVLLPQLLYNNLELWFNGQRPLNPAPYALADSIKQQLAQNTATGTFASLVAEYSQDGSTKNLDGNLGFVEISSLWPEFQGAVESAGPGSVTVVAGRDGLYIFQIQARDNNGPNNSPRAELSEIYLHTGNFQDWYNNEIKNINTKIII